MFRFEPLRDATSQIQASILNKHIEDGKVSSVFLKFKSDDIEKDLFGLIVSLKIDERKNNTISEDEWFQIKMELGELS